MIHLPRPSAPASLIKAEVGATQALWDSWRNQQPIKVSKSVYGTKIVKLKLLKAQHNKCAFCETLFVRDYGQVEHFRPKGGWKQSRQDPLTSPGYFWLAYEWKNLCVSCAMCNDAGHKANAFPLANPSQRATPQNPDIKSEIALLLNPFDDLVEEHISWNRDVPFAKNTSIAGKTTITTFGLDWDEALIDFRRNHFQQIQIILESVETKMLPKEQQDTFLEVLRRALEDHAPYAAMIRAAFQDRIDAL